MKNFLKPFFVAIIIGILGVMMLLGKSKKGNVVDEIGGNSWTLGKESKEKGLYENAHDMLINLESYEALATIKYISNKSENVYLTTQKAKSTGEYKIEIVDDNDGLGTTTIYDGEVIYQYNTRNNGNVYMSTEDTIERSALFLTDFAKNYMTSMESAVAVVSNFNGKNNTIFETTIPGNSEHFVKQKLIVNSKTQEPEQLIILNGEDKELIIVTYETFEYNKGFSEEEFKVVN